MKIQLLSDIHLEFSPLELRNVNADLVVLAGDIGLGRAGIEWIAANIPHTPVVYVLGNHEYYGKAYPKLVHQLQQETRESNIHVLENNEVEVHGTRVLGCTLWTDFDLFGDVPAAEFAAMQVINDYRRIRRSPSYSKLRAPDTSEIHQQSMAWLRQKLDENTPMGKTVVVTHHAPSILSIPSIYRSNILTAAFASNLDGFVSHSPIDVWVHGHLHRGCDYQIGNTRVVSNPRGYPYEKNEDFDPGFLIEI